MLPRLTVMLLLLVGSLHVACQDLDPCIAYTNMTDITRDVFNTPRQGDILICDLNLQPGWYRLVDGLMPTHCLQPFSCGTQAPIWLNGSVPSQAQGIVRMTACANTIPTSGSTGACCGTEIPIDVRNCGEFVVYCLRRPPACPMAYCIESAPRMVAPPVLTGPEIIGDRFRFACGISFPRGIQNIAFNITWSFDGVNIPTLPAQVLTGDQRITFLYQDAWRGNIGKTLRCRADAYYVTTPNVRSPILTSNGYFGGIRITPPVVTVREAGGPQQINVTSTLPVLCTGSRRRCGIQLDIDVTGGSWEDIATANQCLLLLTRGHWDLNTRTATISTAVQATRDFVRDGNQELRVTFIPNYVNAPDIWLGYILPRLRVFTVDGETRRCSAFADPHIRTFEGRDTLHLYEVGDFVLLRSTQRQFEVNIRTNECVGRACVCAVAIMDGPDTIAIDVCRQRWGAPPARVRIMSGGSLATGTQIKRTNDGRNFMISFASGSWLRVQDFATYINVEVQVPAEDFGHVQGICGTFDGNPDNELQGPDGETFDLNDNVPTLFFRSWRLRVDQSLLNGAPRPQLTRAILIDNVNIDTQCLCNNITRTADCGRNRVIQDPVRNLCSSCHDVTDRVVTRTQNASVTDDDNDEPAVSIPDTTAVPDTPNFRTMINFNFTATLGVNVTIITPGVEVSPYPRVRPNLPVEPQITQARANQLCVNAIANFSLGVRCTNIVGFDTSGFVSSCVEDMVAAQSTVFLQAAVSALEAGCQEAILSNISNFGTDGQGRRLPPADATRNICPNQCSMRGVCSAGRCICDPGYSAQDCSVQTSRPPQIIRILRNGLCNSRRRPCRIAFLIVDNFHETPNIACRVRDVRIDNGNLTPGNNFSLVPADFESSREVGCHLPDARVPENRALHGFLISLTTNGALFSNEVLYVVYDSHCLACNRMGQCGIKNDTCLIEGTCRNAREENPRNPSEVCDPDRDQERWTSSLSRLAAFPPPCLPTNNRFDRWDIWTSNQTGCPCFFDKNRTDCACCEAGACQCPDPNPNQCALCSEESRLCGTRQTSPENGVDGWTLSFTGCQCAFDPSRTDCACCQNEGCLCGLEHRNQCSPCGRPEVCGSKPDVFGGLRIHG
ncbi:von Willebrand factor D and EGF domain-containing protein-like [Haliotis asinina]|uniref:von Willebrand factor D and EGF domain-containing protein-like n=1 Tax=Haliotis asinina TaxID=109174 RepID=UPI0035322DE8